MKLQSIKVQSKMQSNISLRIKPLSFLCIPALIVFFASSAFAQERVFDSAGLLSAEESQSLERLADGIAQTYGFDLFIITVRNTGGLSTDAYIDSFFPGYGWDGCVFLQVTETRDYRFKASGRGINILNDAAFNKLDADSVAYLERNDPYEAYRAFSRNWEQFLDLEARGRNYNIFYQWNGLLVFIAWVVSLAIGFIVVQFWKAGMNTALPQTQAAAYVVPNSLAFKEKKDNFLYSTVTKVKRQSQSSSASGSKSGSRGGKY